MTLQPVFDLAPIIGPVVGLLLLLATRRYLGRWPDLWRFRRAVLPLVGRFARDEIETGTAIDDVADALPEKTAMPLQARELVGTIDAPPQRVREAFRTQARVWPATLASIQFETVDGQREWEVGSYALRPKGFLGVWQHHVRLTSAADGAQTRLWAHYERNPWRQPVRHYRSDGWDAKKGRDRIATFAKTVFSPAAFTETDRPE